VRHTSTFAPRVRGFPWRQRGSRAALPGHQPAGTLSRCVRRTAVIVLILLALAPAGVRAATLYRSTVDGALRTRCCCPSHRGSRAPAAPPSEVRPACCCAIIALAARDADARGEPPVPAAPHGIALAVTPVAPALPRPGAARVPPVTRGPPGSLASPALFVRHCSLLL